MQKDLELKEKELQMLKELVLKGMDVATVKETPSSATKESIDFTRHVRLVPQIKWIIFFNSCQSTLALRDTNHAVTKCPDWKGS